MRRRNEILAFFFPIVVWLIVFALWGQFPFGERTLLIWDINDQYAAFFTHLHDILHGDASFFYSLSDGVGGNMYAVAVYYLLSPFNLLFFFFDASNIYVGVLLVLLLKIGACGLCMFLYLKSVCKDDALFPVILFSTAYGCAAWTTAYAFNVMWLDVVIVCPLMAMGIDRILKKEKSLLYLCALSYALITNFYMAYMLCVFSVIYFVCAFLSSEKDARAFQSALQYAGQSLLSGGVAAFALLPTYRAVSSIGGASEERFLLNFSRLTVGQSLIRGWFTGTIQRDQLSTGKPLLYCGVFALVFALYFLLQKHSSVGEKLRYLLPLCLVCGSFLFYNLDLIWNAGHPPVGSNYRYAFFASFLLLCMGCRGATLYCKTNDRSSQKTLLLAVALLVALVVVCRRILIYTDTSAIVFVNLGCLLAWGALFLFSRKKELLIGAAALLGFELCFNAVSYYQKTGADAVFVAQYQNELSTERNLLSQARGDADVPFRLEYADGFARNNLSFLLNTGGVGVYTSMEHGAKLRLRDALGYANLNNGNNGVWRDTGTRAADALLNVRYLLTAAPFDDYDVVASDGAYFVAKNPYALPFAFFASPALTHVAYREYDTFQYLNGAFRAICPTDDDLFTPLPFRITSAQNCELTIDGVYAAQTDDAKVVCQIQTDDVSDGCAYLRYELDVRDPHGIVVDVDGNVSDLGAQDLMVRRIGALDDGDTASVVFTFHEGQSFDPARLHIAVEHTAPLKEVAEAASAQTVAFDVKSERHIRIEADNDNPSDRLLVVTLPIDDGWTVTVDGQKTEPLSVLEGCMAVSLSSGAHVVELRYFPPLLREGLIISAVSIAVVFLLARFRAR